MAAVPDPTSVTQAAPPVNFDPNGVPPGFETFAPIWKSTFPQNLLSLSQEYILIVEKFLHNNLHIEAGTAGMAIILFTLT